MPHASIVPCGWILTGSLLLSACASTSGGSAPRSYRIDNTVSAHCRNGGVNCVATMGQDVLLERLRDTAIAGLTVSMAADRLDEEARRSIEEALVECADAARDKVLIANQRYYSGLSPTPEECNRMVTDKSGHILKLAIKLGSEMHEEALKCAEEHLDKKVPGRFSREPRYRYDSRTKRMKMVSPEEVQALRDTGNIGELKGSIVPDIVIHTGTPLQIQAIYDYKFPCADTDNIVPWDTYPEGHPNHRLDQGTTYHRLLGVKPARIQPRLGVIR